MSALQDKVTQQNRENKQRSRRRGSLRLLCVLVALCTLYTLLLPAFTLEKESFCSKEEHKHSEACYSRPLICELEESEGHTHAEECYGTVRKLICGQEESEGHSHTDACYEVSRKLVCSQDEVEAHTHNENCYDENGELICGKEETEGHTHTDACYEEARTLICGQEESEGHTHTDACYEETEGLICGKEESEGHTHTDACYGEKKLICGKEEHTHSLACYSNPNADLENEYVWTSTLPALEGLSQADAVVAVAASQLGYHESTANYQVAEDGTVHGYTRYGAWYGVPYGDWCAMFASFCLHYAGIDSSVMPYECGCSRWIDALREKGMYVSAAEASAIFPGDLIFYTSDGANPCHMGVIKRVDAEQGTLTVIEGNFADDVHELVYSLGDSRILGYGRLPENLALAKDTTAEDSAEPESTDAETNTTKNENGSEETVNEDPHETVTLTAETESWRITTVTNGLPSGEYTLSASRAAATAEATEKIEKSLSSVLPNGIVKRAHVAQDSLVLLELTILGKDGKDVEPDGEVQVRVETKTASVHKLMKAQRQTEASVEENADAEKTTILHFGSKGLEQLTAESTGGALQFVTESFSVFALSYTVDFSYEGFTYQIPGVNSILLSDLLPGLNIPASIADVADVFVSLTSQKDETCYASELYVVEQEGDWLLKSDIAFGNEYALTVTMQDGTQYIITVTDDSSQTQDITSLLSGVSITINGQEVTGDTWEVVKGSTYHMTLEFQEINHGEQFPDDDTTMTYKLPAGFQMEATSGTFDMKFGKLGTLKNNTYEVLSDGTIRVHWNTSDPDNFYWLTASSSAHFEIELDVIFDGSANHFQFNEEIGKDATIEEPHDASVSKTANYNAATGMMDYTVTISSVGTTENIVVADSITGSALTLDPSTLKYDGQAVDSSWIQSSDAHGFHLTIPSIGNGETKTLTYSAAVDYSKLSGNGQASAAQVGNGIVITPEEDDNPDNNTSNTYSHTINYSSISKSSTGVSEAQADGSKVVEWKITANTERKVPLTHISDSINSDSTAMSYDTSTPLTVVVTKQNGSTETRTVQWSELTHDSTSWTYNIPQSDGIASYEITYKTIVANTDTMAENQTVKNTTSDDNGSSTGTAIVGPVPSGDDNPIQVDKSYTDVSATEIGWQIVVNIPAEGYTENFEVVDSVPVRWVDNVKEIEGLIEDSLSVEGLSGSESYVVDASNPEQVRIRFYEDENHTNQGLSSTASNRTLTITLRTENSERWLEYAGMPGYSWLKIHTNKATVYANGKNKSDESGAVPSTPKITKGYKSHASYTENGVDYPVYRYYVLFEGVNTDSLSVTDTFDTSILKLATSNEIGSWAAQHNCHITYSDNTYGIGEHNIGTIGEPVTVTETDTGLTFTVDQVPKKENGTYYNYYSIVYYLRVKDAEALKTLQQQAAEAGGTTQIHNLADWDGATSSVDVDFTYKVISKDVTYPQSEDTERYPHYTITINPNCDTLNNGETMTLTDSFTNQSIDFKSITIKVYNADGSEDTAAESRVTYDFRGNTGTFYVPDGKKIVIEYDATVIGDGVVEYSNKATLNGKYSDEITEMKEQSVMISGGASIIYIDLFKYEREEVDGTVIGHMEDGLNGATFRLLDSNKQPIIDKNGNEVTFTTSSGSLDAQGKNGYAMIMLNQKEQGITLDWETTYYLEETVPPPGFARDNIQYSFQISDHANYEAPGGVYVYHIGDILKVADWAEEPGFKISKRFAGNETLTDEQKKSISFEVTGPFNASVASIEGITVTSANYPGDSTILVPYSLFNGDGIYSFTFDSGTIRPGTFTVKECNADSFGYTWSGKYSVNSGSDVTMTSADQPVSATLTDGNSTTDVLFTNNYHSNSFVLHKLESGTENSDEQIKLQNAVFTVYAYNNGSFTATELTYSTARNGTFELKKTDSPIFQNDTAYYLVETEAPEGYQLPETPEKYYFYFASAEGAVPAGIPEGATAFDLNHQDGSVTALNELRPTKSVSVEKAWSGDPESPVEVQLMRVKTEVEAEDAAVGDPVTLSADNSWMYTWEDLPDGQYYVVENTQLSDYEAPTYQVSGDSTEASTVPSDAQIDLTKVTTGTIAVINTHKTEDIIVRKLWKNSDGQTVPAPVSSISFKLHQTTAVPGGGSDQEYTVNLAVRNTWNKNNYEPAAFSVRAGQILEVSMTAVIDAGHTLSLSTADMPTVTVGGTTYSAQQTGENAFKYTITLPGTDGALNITISNMPIDWYYSWTYEHSVSDPEIGSGGDDGDPVMMPDGSGGYTVDPSGSYTFTLTAADNWTQTFTGLPKTGTDGSGNEVNYLYYVEETTPGYAVTYTTTADDGSSPIPSGTLTITNETEGPQTTEFSFSKIWEDENGAEVPWPDGKTITVTLKAGNTVVETVTLDRNGLAAGSTSSYPWTVTTDPQTNRTTFTVSGLPVLPEGQSYSVSELQAEDYKSPSYAYLENGELTTSENATAALNGQCIVNIPNVAYELPKTGGVGVWPILGAGLLLTLAALWRLLFARHGPAFAPTEGPPNDSHAPPGENMEARGFPAERPGKSRGAPGKGGRPPGL